jgi:VWFA-related protein
MIRQRTQPLKRHGMKTSIRIAFASVGVVIGAALSAQQPPAGQLPAFRSGVEVVSVDVGVVNKDGQPVHDLGPGDFKVTVGGQLRHVVTAEFIDLARVSSNDALNPDPAAVSTNEGGGVGRMVMFVVDQNTLDIGSTRQVGRSAASFFAGLTYDDRSALALLPVGKGIGFTWAHATVREALQKVVGMGGSRTTWEYGSLAEARDVANSNSMALRDLGQRECGGGFISASNGAGGGGGGGGLDPGGGAGQSPGPASGTGSAGGNGAAGSGSGSSSGASGGQTGSNRGNGGSSGSGGVFGMSSCARNLQMQAEAVWRSTETTSQSSIAAFRQMLAALANVRGDKTVILISGGWPLDEREETTLMATLAADAAAARATIFTIYVPTSTFSADRRGISHTPARDQYIHLGPLETLAGMTGGGTYRAEVNADVAFERIRRELGGYYRLGVEKDPTDATGRNRHMKVEVARGSLTVRARDLFDIRTYEDRDWAARLSSALESPAPASSIGLRMTSYITANRDDARRVNIVLAGEASRLQPGEAVFQVLVRDMAGRSVLSGEKPLGDAEGSVLPFSAEIPVVPGSYIVRLGVMDAAGRVGSVDHRVDAEQVSLGALTASRPLLIRVPAGANAEPRVAFEGVRQDERLALQVDLEGDSDRLANLGVTFEVAATREGPALLQTPASLSRGARDGSMLAQGVANVRVLPPGSYVLRAKVMAGEESLGEVRRPFAVTEAPRAIEESTSASPNVVRPPPAQMTARNMIPPFAVEQVMAPAVLGVYLDQVSLRPDAASPAIGAWLDRARSGRSGEIDVPDAEAGKGPVAAFLRGLSLLASRKLEPAATSFRRAMNLSDDFYPAMVYLGACYAAGGRDKEAAGAWRTALIKEGDAVSLHVLLADALLRQGQADLALAGIERARARWPYDETLHRRFALAALMAGHYVEGLDGVDRLVSAGVKDEPSLALALLVLYEAFEKGRPIQTAEQDRARMIRLSDGYKAQGGPSLALVETWVAAATEKR